MLFTHIAIMSYDVVGCCQLKHIYHCRYYSMSATFSLSCYIQMATLFFVLFLNTGDDADASEGIISMKHARLSESLITAVCVFTLLNHA